MAEDLKIGKCDFCNKTPDADDVYIIQGVSAYICNECVEVCYEMVQDKKNSHNQSHKHKIAAPNPHDIRAALDKAVVGQEYAKKVLSVSVSNHFQRIYGTNHVKIEKSNILLIGPTGCGKTHIAKALAEYLNVPFSISDATSITESGYVGDDVNSILSTLLSNAHGDVEAAQRGIVYIDEIDKIAKRQYTMQHRDISGEGVQQALLKLLEGSTIPVPVSSSRRGNGQQNTVPIDTTNILFICGGSFDGLDKEISERRTKSGIGFGQGPKITKMFADNQDIEANDLIKYGFIAELVGRLPLVSRLEKLTTEDLVKILTEPQNSIVSQFEEIFRGKDVALRFEDEALANVALRAYESGTGARGLRRYLEKVLLDVQYNISTIDSKSIVVTSSMVDEELDGAKNQAYGA